MNNRTRRQWNEAVQAQQAGNTKKQWVNAQVKQANSQTARETARKVADVVWGC